MGLELPSLAGPLCGWRYFLIRRETTMEMTCLHVLVVDDDLDMCSQLSDYLGRNDFRVTAVNTAKQMLDFIAREAVDLLLLEPRLRGEDGLRLTRTVRESSSMPIVVMSERDEVVDRVMGLELGADDYVTKPFSLRELLARIRAVLRRCKVDVPGPARANTPRAYRFAGWELNVRLYRLNSPDGSRVEISRGEIGLLRALLSSPERILTREQLLELTHMDSAEVYDRSIDTQIMRLRRKIEADPTEPRFIRTERGTGYYFDAPVSAVR
jgi:DNA-binding response OmpR family regulator